jgi:molybdopterin/thiamine biosynthesis adenylyltransferase
MTSPFTYEEAFSRNIGWLTREEQGRLKGKRVAIAGLGGVGGSHLLTLTRLGVGAFTLAELDRFELANFNRQAGANLSSLGKSKLSVMVDAARDINPTLSIREHPEGVTGTNVAQFLQGADLYADGLDFFAFEARALVFRKCAELAIPAVTAAPLGMGVSLINFLPGEMSFEDYFRWAGCSDEEKAIRFLVGLSPLMPHRAYLADASAVSLRARRGPSTPMACELCAGVVATEALKILLNRGHVTAAPVAVQFDAYRNKLVRTWRPGGNRNPLQILMLAFARRQLGLSSDSRVAVEARED